MFNNATYWKCHFLTLASSLLCLLSSLAFAESPSSIGQVVWVKGVVQALTEQNPPRTLQRSSPIYQSDSVVTDKSGSGQITFTDGTLLSLRPNTTIRLVEYKHGGTTPPSEDAFVVDVVKGGFRTVTGVISKNHPDGYEVKTPMGTIGVQGTIYDVLYNATSKKLTVGIDRGKITIKPVQGNPVILTQGTSNVAAIITATQTRILNAKPVEISSMLKIISPSTSQPVSNPESGNGTKGKNVIV